MRYKNLQDRKKYNTARNKVKSMVAKQRKIFKEKIAANAKDNPKVIYQYINSKSKSRTAVGTLCKDPNNKNSDKMEDDQEKANILSEYFASNFVKEPLGELRTLETRKLKSQMQPLKIDQATTYQILNKLKPEKSAGVDNYHPMFLKRIALYISGPLSVLYQKSLDTMNCLNEWLKALIIAIFKKGVKCLAENYHTISLTSIFAKVWNHLLRNILRTTW